jgi:hypothetical protein
VLVVDNDQWLHNTRKAEFQKNLLRKRKSGKYDFEKSIRLFRYLVDEADKAERGVYRRFADGTMYIDSRGVEGFTYDVPTRNLAARMFAEEFREQVNEKPLAGDDYVAPFGELTWMAKAEGILKPPKAKKKATKKKATKKKTAKKKATKKKASQKDILAAMDK